MVTAIMLFSVMDGLSKYLTTDYHPIQVVWVRYLIMLLLLLPLAAARWAERPFRSRQPLQQSARGVFIVGSGLLFVSGLAHLPLAQATATGFVAPMFVTALSIPLLGEKVGIRRWLAVAVGFAGVLVIVRPTSSGFEPAALWPILSAATWAMGIIITRKMRLADPALTTLLFTASVGVISAAIPALLVWREITPLAWVLLTACGALSLLGQYFQVRAFANGPASLLAPFSYSSIIVSTAIGVMLFHHFPDLWTWIGAAIVVASGVYVWHRERVRAREHALALAASP